MQQSLSHTRNDFGKHKQVKHGNCLENKKKHLEGCRPQPEQCLERMNQRFFHDHFMIKLDRWQ